MKINSKYAILNLGDINGIPRVLDAGQCNDSYSLALIALKLKEVFELNDIKTLKRNKKNYITINSIVVNPSFQNGITIKLLSEHLRKYLKKMHKSGFIIDGINAVAVSNDGMKYLERLGFTKTKVFNVFCYINSFFGIETKTLLTYSHHFLWTVSIPFLCFMNRQKIIGEKDILFTI